MHAAFACMVWWANSYLAKKVSTFHDTSLILINQLLELLAFLVLISDVDRMEQGGAASLLYS